MNLRHKYTLEDIVKGCQEGRAKFQKLLYELMSPKMLGVCMRYAKDDYEAEDMLQNAFIKIFQKIDSYRGEGSFEGWVRKIVINTSIEYYRKNLRGIHTVDIDELGEDIAFTAFDMSRINIKALMKLIQSLPVGYRLVFNMYAIEGYSHKEIAGQLGITEGASKSQLSRARAILREKVLKMEEQGYEINVG